MVPNPYEQIYARRYNNCHRRNRGGQHIDRYQNQIRARRNDINARHKIDGYKSDLVVNKCSLGGSDYLVVRIAWAGRSRFHILRYF